MIEPLALRNGLNFVAFQLGWFACVLRPGAGAACLVLALVGLHIALVSRQRLNEAVFILTGAVLGTAMDSLWHHAGVIRFPPYSLTPAWLIPVWLMAIWLLFMTTLNHSLQWVARRPWTRWLLPAISGPLAYASASSLGALSIGFGGWGYLCLAASWLVLYPSLVSLSRRLSQTGAIHALA